MQDTNVLGTPRNIVSDIKMIVIFKMKIYVFDECGNIV